MRSKDVGLAVAASLIALLTASCEFDDPVGAGGGDSGPRDRPGPGNPLGAVSCELPDSLLADGGVQPNAIPALTNPDMVSPGHADLSYLDEDSRVLGVVVDGEPRAYPHNILWWHEIVNDRVGGQSIAVTFCPLTGSGLVFDRATMRNRPDMGVSGLLFANNLVMYDREIGALYGPQMSVDARCSGFRGVEPSLVAVTETSWARWKELHPETVVVGGDTGHRRDYQLYPYGDYDIKTNPVLLVRMHIDGRRLPKERVLGMRTGAEEGVGYPFDELARLGDRGVVVDVVDDRPVVIFWEAREGGTAVAPTSRSGSRGATSSSAPGSGLGEPGGGAVRARFVGARSAGPVGLRQGLSRETPRPSASRLTKLK